MYEISNSCNKRESQIREMPHVKEMEIRMMARIEKESNYSVLNVREIKFNFSFSSFEKKIASKQPHTG